MPPPTPGTGLTRGDAEPAAAGPTAAAAGSTAAAGPAESQPTESRPTPRPSASTPSRPTTTSTGPGLGAALKAALWWGPLAIGVATLLQMWAADLAGAPFERPLQRLTVLLEGGSGLVSGDPLVGLGINIVLGLVLGVVFALMTPLLRSARAVLAVALVYGAAVFAVDHYLLAPALNPVLEARPEAFGLATRLVFGAVLALGFVGQRD